MSGASNLGSCGNGRFQLIRRIGSGGMGIVYEALDRNSQNRVALKTLKEIDAAAIYRIKWEFRSLAQISHPHLIQLYELICDAGSWFFTMELVEGSVDFISYLRGTNVAGPDQLASTVMPDLGDTPPGNPPMSFLISNNSHASQGTRSVQTDHLVRESPVCAIQDFDRLRDLFRQLSEGVAALHRTNRLHRDLKPGNALVAPDGRVVILDFGLVAEIDASADGAFRSTTLGEAAHGNVMGTSAYMAPEQAAGQRLTAAGDWYAVGVMLFQALTGRLPFTGPSRQVLLDKQRSAAPAPSDLVSGIPDDLNGLCCDLLARGPANRPTAEEVIALLAPAGTPMKSEPTLPAQSNVFIGRRDEIAGLVDALATARDGATVVCHLQGSSGAGKTTLIERFLKQATAEGAVVLRGRCYENESVPYKGIDALVDALTRHLLQLPEAELAAAVPRDVANLARMFPVLNRVPLIRQLASASPSTIDMIEGRHVAFSALGAILRFLSLRQALVVVIDDLHWGDLESAALLNSLVLGAEPPPMLLLFAYRSEYLARSECLRSLAPLPERGGGRLLRRDISVGGFTAIEAKELAKALLSKSAPDVDRQAEWIAAESGGSALFVNELVRYALSAAGASHGAATELDDVIWQRIERLPGDVRALLEFACVSGRPLRLIDLQRAAGTDDLPLKALMQLRSDRLVRLDGIRSEQMLEPFHDRIRETVIAHLPPTQLSATHGTLAIALEIGGAAEPEVLAEHFAHSDRFDKASRYSAAAAAHAATMFAFERAEQLYLRAMGWAKDVPDRVLIAEQLIHFYTDTARFADAYATARNAAGLLGFSLPGRFVAPLFLWDWAQLEIRLRGRAPHDLLDLPVASDQRIESVIRLLNAVAKAAYQVRPELCVWVAVKLVNLCIRYGNTRDCAIGYMVFGAIFKGGVNGNYDVGHAFGRLALDLVERFRNDRQRAEVNFVVGYFGTAWKRPAIEAERLWDVAYRAGIDSGDLFHTGCAAAGTLMGMFMRGAPFPDILARAKDYEAVLRPADLREPLGVLQAVRQAVRNLAGSTDGADTFSGSGFNEEDFVATLSGYGSRHFAHVYFIAKMQTLFMWGRHERAVVAAQASERYLRDSTGVLHQSEHLFFSALIACESARRSPSAKAAPMRTAARSHRQFQRWAKECPDNFLARERLIAAEVARNRGQTMEAAIYYDQALKAAADVDQAHLEGLTRMLLSTFLSDQGRWTEAKAQREAAASCLRSWGAIALADDLAHARDRVEAPIGPASI